MRFTYDLNTNGCLILTANIADQTAIREMVTAHECDYCAGCEADALESLIANSELGWIAPEEIGALTSAPILGLRDQDGKPDAAWAFMDYQVRSFLADLLQTGRAVFIS